MSDSQWVNGKINWRSRIVRYGKIRADQVEPHPLNPRKHPIAQRQAVQASFDTLGQIAPIIINERNGLLVDGAERSWLALAQGDETEIDAIWIDLSEEEHALALTTYDYITYMATYDRDNLESLLQEIETDDPSLQALLDDLAAQNDIALNDIDPAEDVGPQTDRAEELQAQWQVKRGDVWCAPSKTGKGVHRLMCGDSTNAADVARLMDGKQTALVVTDPPYGVEYADKNAFLNAIAPANRIQTPIAGDHGSKGDMQDLWRAAFANVYSIMSPGAVLYCFMPQGGDQMMMMMALMHVGIEPRHELIWLKNNHVLGRTDYAYKHEPILYAWKEGGHKFYGDFQTSVIEVAKPQKSDLHPTMKPVELIVILIENSSLKGQILYEPFSGSGTTLIAAEQTGRICHAMELEPKYVSVALQRLKDMGLDPRRDTDTHTIEF